MKKLFVGLLTASLVTACGVGESESSGGSNPALEHHSTCSISKENKIVFVDGDFGCKANVPEINKGRTFSARCLRGAYDDQIYIEATGSGDLERVKKSVETGKPYIFVCGSPKSLLSTEKCLETAKNRMEEMECSRLAMQRRNKNY